MNDVLQLLLANLDAAYERSGWHGPNLKGSLRGVSAATALFRPAPKRHNIWELAVHAAYWKYAVRRRLTGVPRGSFPLPGSNWIASPSRADERTWKTMVRLLDEQHQLLRQAISSMSPAQLRDPKKLRMVYGVAAHDAYHTGQIQLTKRFLAK